LATCYDPTGSSSGLHSNQLMFRELRTFLGSQTMFTVGKCGRFMSNNYIWKMWKIHVQQLHMVNVEGSCPTTTYGNLAL